MALPKVPYRRTSDPAPPASIELEGQRIDHAGGLSNRWHQHPQMMRPQQRGYAPYGQPPYIDPDLPPMVGPDGQPLDPAIAAQYAAYGYPAAPGTHVEVNNNGQFYRPLKEELTLSFAKTIGNLFAWPFRLVGGLVENIMMAGVGVLKMLLIAIVMPLVLFTGYQYYQDNQDRPATEIAAELGKDGVGLVGAMLGGIWDGIFGDDEPEASAQTPGQQGTPAAK